jgi:hypothetical protein
MKKRVVLLLLLRVCFSLAAQSGVSVYVPPVTGTGSGPEDNYLFYRLLLNELAEQNYAAAKAQNRADFSLIAALYPDLDENVDVDVDEYGELVVTQFFFHLELMDNKTGNVTVDGQLVYEIPSDVISLFPVLVYTLLSTIPRNTDNQNDEWRNMLLYAGGSAFWNPRVYFGDAQSAFFANFSGGLFAEFHFIGFMSAELGLGLAIDWVSAVRNEDYRNLVMEIPLLVKFVIKPGDHLMLEPYVGIRYNFPFYDTINTPMFSCLAGFQYGVKVGPGVLIIDPRFTFDIGDSSLEALSGDTLDFQRYAIYIGVGYKYGFIKKK